MERSRLAPALSGAPALALGAAAACGLAVFRCFDAQISWLLPPCPLHFLTGLYCPGCGSTRAVRSLLHGDLLAAWHFNPLLLLALPLLAAMLVSARYSARPIAYSPRLSRAVLYVVVLFGIARNIPVAPFTALAPH